MKVTIEVEVRYCEKCPYSITKKVYTPDPFESVREVRCEKLDKIIYHYLDWNEKSVIPDECPFINEKVL